MVDKEGRQYHQAQQKKLRDTPFQVEQGAEYFITGYARITLQQEESLFRKVEDIQVLPLLIFNLQCNRL